MDIIDVSYICTAMEEWELDFQWLQLRHRIKKLTNSGSPPDLKAILFLIGMQEYGHVRKDFSKEEKRDLIHVAACTLLEIGGYYEFDGRDDDGWPHFKVKKPFDVKGLKEQEEIMKTCALEYFKKLEEDPELIDT